MKSSVVTIKNMSKKYSSNNGFETLALSDLSFEVTKGEFIGIMGPSGSGKSTLLNILSTIDTPTSGEVIIDKKNISKFNSAELATFRGKKIGFIFQDFNLLENLTAFENISIPLSLQGVNSTEINQRINEVSQLLGIEMELKKYPSELSGGQKQRVAAARALINDPSILLADEPTGALDSKNGQELLLMMDKINSVSKVTILMVTHDAVAASYCHRILFIKDGCIHNELARKENTRQIFYNNILDTIRKLEGEQL